jgi:putative protease
MVTKTYRQAIDAYYAGTYSKDKVAAWLLDLETVYNRGFWSGYYLGQKLGEWNDSSGSKATQKKIYIGQGKHYYPKTEIAEFELDAFDLEVGDKVFIQGPTTGSQEMEITSIWLNDVSVQKAVKGDVITFKTPFRVRLSDKLYKIVKSEYAKD